MRKLITVVIALTLFGCAATKAKPKKVLTKRVVKGPPRVVTRSSVADRKFVLIKVRTALHNLVYAHTDNKTAVEVHARGKACRVAISGDLTLKEQNGLGVACLNVLSMYFEDFLVTINERVYRLSGVSAPDDGEVTYGSH